MPPTTARRRRPKAKNAESSQSSSDQYLSRAVGRALNVLECFPDAFSSYSLKEISQRTDMPESSLFRLLVTLESRGYLQQNTDGSYRLAPRVLHGQLRQRANVIRDLVHPHLVELARQFNETTSLSFLFEDHIAVLDSIESFHDIRAINKVGRILPPYASSMGKAITAFQERPVIDRLVEVYGLFRRTEKTITDHGSIFTEFEQVRQTGYAFDRGEATEGGICIGAPIYSRGSRVEAAVSISVPLIRMDEARQRKIIAELLGATKKMSAALQENA